MFGVVASGACQRKGKKKGHNPSQHYYIMENEHYITARRLSRTKKTINYYADDKKNKNPHHHYK